MSEMLPKVRFQGFTGDWEERKLGQYTKLITKGTTPKDKTGIGDVNFVKVENITNGKIYPISKIKQNEHDNYLKRSRLEEKDILFSIAGTLGRTAIVNKSILPANTNQALAIIRGYDFDTNFLITSLAGNVVKEYIRRNPTVGAQPNLSLEQVGNLLVNTPNAEEQQKIGSFFKLLDDTIALHQRKLDLLKEQKKGFLQKMFPKDGQLVPEVRFAGFTDDWEERKLGELSNIVGGGTPSTSNPEYWDGDIDWYAPAEIGEQSYVSKSKKTITELGLKKSSARILPVGTVLFTSRAGIGNTAILAKEATTNQGFQSIVPDQNKLDSYFIFSRTNELKRYGEVTGAGSTFVEVSGKQMSKMSIMVPELSEQQKLGSFFKQLDDTIALHQRKLDSLKEQKKGFLQKMFVSS